MKLFLYFVSATGLLLFGLLLLSTFLIPDSIERAGQLFIKYQIQKEVDYKIGPTSPIRVEKNVESLLKKFELGKKLLEKKLEINIPEKIASTIAKMCRVDCERRKELGDSIAQNIIGKIDKLEKAKNNLALLIVGKYHEILHKLTKDVRIFLACNTIMFFMLILISYLRPHAVRHLLLPAILLVITTAVSSCFYVLGQNWFFTIIYSDYMGWCYGLYTVAIFGILFDIALNKARVTTRTINAISNVIGSAFSVAPC